MVFCFSESIFNTWMDDHLSIAYVAVGRTMVLKSRSVFLGAPDVQIHILSITNAFPVLNRTIFPSMSCFRDNFREFDNLYRTFEIWRCKLYPQKISINNPFCISARKLWLLLFLGIGFTAIA